MSAFFKRSSSSSSLAPGNSGSPKGSGKNSPAGGSPTLTATPGSAFLDPSSAFTSLDDNSGGSGSKSPRKIVGKILSRTSSRQSLKEKDAEGESGRKLKRTVSNMSASSATSVEAKDGLPAEVEGLSISGGNNGSSNSTRPSPLSKSYVGDSATDPTLPPQTMSAPPFARKFPSSTGPLPASKAAASTTTTVRQPPGHIGNLTDAQESALLAFAKKLQAKDLLHPFPTLEDPIDVAALNKPTHSQLGDQGQPEDTGHDIVSLQRMHLLRWLRARNWDIDQAVEMYAKAHAWKFDPKGLDLEGKLQNGWTFKEEEQVADLGWRMYFHKTDKLGRPIFVQDLSNIDTIAIFKLITPDQIIEKFAVTLESAMRYRYTYSSQEAERGIEDNFMILNVEGLGLSTFWNMKNQLQTLLGILDNNFPELSGRVQIINAPWVFATIFSYIRGWLPPATREKVDIRGADYKDVLLEYIEPDALPRKLGGTCTCEMENGCGRSDKGPWPKDYREFLELRKKDSREAANGSGAREASAAGTANDKKSTAGSSNESAESKIEGSAAQDTKQEEADLKAAVEIKVEEVHA